MKDYKLNTVFDIHFVTLAMCFESFYNVRGEMRHWYSPIALIEAGNN